MKLLSSASVLLLAVGLTGCASAPQSMAPHAATGIQRLAVVSVTGGEFIRQYVGVTQFGNEREKKSIVSWNLDKAYEAQMGEAAEQVLGATVVPVVYPAADFKGVDDIRGPVDIASYWGPHWDAIEAPVRGLCAANRLDSVLVAVRQKTPDVFGDTNRFVYGAGIHTTAWGASQLHLLSSLSLVDCKSGKTLARQWLTQSPTGELRDRLVTAPLPTEVSRTPIPEWTPEIESRLRQALVDLPKTAWVSTLRSMVPQK
ncbi:hypothetical protein [Hydrogenophaga sp. 2FB]|uniref:hypothetical protein n=1 Tax=Hydrogenophaga sp. 2FB TaxID=2502187 RepID=UPI0010F9F833|nr:hypothetical protein [Hydrogenophaga sp. 2FB]